MSELLLDVSRLVGRRLKGRLPTGIDRVMLAYVGRYAAQARAVISKSGATLFLDRKASDAIFAWLQTTDPSSAPWTTVAGSLLRTGMAPKAGSIFLNAGHSGLESPAYLRMLDRHLTRPLFVVHDLIPITHPQLCRAGEAARHRTRIDAVLERGNGVICNSQATLEALAEHGRLIGKTPPPMLCAPLATDIAAVPPGPQASPALRSEQAQPYFVLIGTIEPRKNHAMILQVWQRLVERLGKRAPRLYLIGQRGWECEHVIRVIERNEKLREFVIELGRCDDRTMNSLLAGARALLFPTVVEGYGMPVIEALAGRIPVIASDLPVFREFAGDVPDYLDCLDAIGWMKAIEEYMPLDSPARLRQLARHRHFKIPSWSEHFAKVDAFMSRIAEMPRRVA